MNALPTPYYDRDGITIYHADCRDVLPLLPAGSVDLVLTDPPYGKKEETERKSRGRSGANPYSKWDSRDFPAIKGDSEPFDPSILFRFPRLILFGANYYADKLPVSPSWIVWDKVDGLTSKREVGFNDNADCELAWSNLGCVARIFRHRWMGLLTDTEIGEKRVHPTQKPIALMRDIIAWQTEMSALILDPYFGSGPVLIAAKQLGRRAIGIEIEERYCAIAIKRLAQMVMPL